GPRLLRRRIPHRCLSAWRRGLAVGDGDSPGELLAQGRAADVFAVGDGRVLRRYREGEHDDVAPEAAAMEHARHHGFPVPAVHEASGRDLVMERVDGPTMLGDLERRPWLVVRHGRTLAELHRRLHDIPAPEGI